MNRKHLVKSAQEKEGTEGLNLSLQSTRPGDATWSKNAGMKQLCLLSPRFSKSLFCLKTDSGEGKGN